MKKIRNAITIKSGNCLPITKPKNGLAVYKNYNKLTAKIQIKQCDENKRHKKKKHLR